jgi:hypothetical protein
MVSPQYDGDGCANLVFLEESDVIEAPEYLVCPEEPNELHPLLHEAFSDWVVDHNRNLLWEPSERLWAQKSYFVATILSNTTDGGFQSWTKPDLQSKPIITLQQKLDFLQRRQKYDREREAQRVRVTLTAQGYNSLEVSVPCSRL